MKTKPISLWAALNALIRCADYGRATVPKEWRDAWRDARRAHAAFSGSTRTEAQLRERLALLKSDERMHAPPANVHVNCVLALIQCEVGGKINALEWALGLPISVFPLKRQGKK